MKPGLRGLLFTAAFALSLTASAADAQKSPPPTKKLCWGEAMLRMKAEWYASPEARAAAGTMLLYQSREGAWPKNRDLCEPPASPEALAEIQEREGNTIDNGATTGPMRFLALVATASGDAPCRAGVVRGVDYLLAAQYPTGGFPQFYPLRTHGYYSRITYNDDAMIRALTLLRDLASGKEPFAFLDAERRTKAARAVERGVRCILETQIVEDGKLTAWCAQHDETTLAPAWGRAYEPPSLSASESVGIVRFLMEIDQPTPEIARAIEGTVTWLKAVAIRGVRVESFITPLGERDARVVVDPAAGPLWARFYELGTHRPLFMDRDSKPVYTLGEIDRERRGGYAYYGTWGASLLATDYPKWRATLPPPSDSAKPGSGSPGPRG